ncbi:hypothetical protein ACNFH5_15495 [Pseudomonas sp. NY15435]|uniref:hypothetical protein n=1 Tax=Pseudomonas sp. NY15435 TaxID=3400358 RepID=UPI003A8C25A7
MKDTDLQTIELATLAFLELTPSLREQIKLLIPASMPHEQAGELFRHKAWSELCNAAKQAGIQPMEYASRVIELYRADLAKNIRLRPDRGFDQLGLLSCPYELSSAWNELGEWGCAWRTCASSIEK